ncbi:spermidine synthase [Stutzerimonas nitrititolerans]|uniref:Spermidine synthase n=1 Tax=Stutzerimonas nitrititolerans TaxID=2482751 RepID=A0AA42BG78_9GAMM|nr:spermidine synthase [Stutzerimonas nitrititolerans]AFN77303.1 spermidine synthase [Stutzerimonas stutzeri DSM 10701]KRW74991.1 spermidine synthase [Pseudomonas sp. TTU2014-096BSC]MBA1235672.1 spermidine synthase [Stutzerimonas stutzeri]WAD27887.1 spermidine synthase [Pseudomonadaceae bacterium T75]MCO7544888.1 spermidine synthase [Stutzerimonas nitrititolerans]
MDKQEELLAEVRDEFGLVRVLQVGDYRFLEFGAAVEQSCVFMRDPSWLEYDYTRAMLMGALCHPAPETALFLGLGAGTLTQACLEFLPLEDVEAIELRPAVPELAMRYLGLQNDSRLYVRIGDAVELLESAETADLIFVDLYTDVGPAAAHLAWNFLKRCQEKLNPDGWLIINQWGTDDDKPLGAALLRGLFHRHYWECPVKEGNVVLLVPAELEQTLDEEGLRQRAACLAPRLGYSLDSLIAALRPAS